MKAGAIKGALLLLFVGCVLPTEHAGGVTDTGNSNVASIVGRVTDPAGQPLADAIVKARTVTLSTSFDEPAAQDVRSAVSGFDGGYVIDSVYPGEYRIHIATQQLAAQYDLTVSDGDTLIETGIQRLAEPSLITGRVKAVDSLGNLIVSDSIISFMKLRVVLLGLDITDTITAADNATFTLGGVPAGKHVLIVSSSSGHHRAATVAIDSLLPGEQRDLDTIRVFTYGKEALSDWQYNRGVILRTGADGVALNEPQEGFPLLVRLNAGNFDFAQALGTGADIRFTNSEMKLLPYEIDYYDSAAAQAAIWVRTDTIRPDSINKFLMYWGNAAAPNFSLSRDVFRGVATYTGVYHMNRNARGDLVDASEKAHHAVPYTTAPPTAGYIGAAQYLDGTEDYIQIEDSSFTDMSYSLMISAWVKLDTIGENRYHTLISQRKTTTDSLGYSLRCNPLGNGGLGEVSLQGTGELNLAGATSWSDGWHMIAVSVHESRGDIYFDGQRITSATDSLTIIRNSAPVTIGGLAGAGDFKGIIDELTVAGRPRSAEWIRLLWENQRTDSPLVSFE